MCYIYIYMRAPIFTQKQQAQALSTRSIQIRFQGFFLARCSRSCTDVSLTRLEILCPSMRYPKKNLVSEKSFSPNEQWETNPCRFMIVRNYTTLHFCLGILIFSNHPG